ncbi:hypothetical protein VTK73DRAFT_5141 [Phialemonium thermophilum]|uniref:DUF7770 domain-containing protein n=1 Tax=Phialemonium thermophilum TaxID=223376 RepID=A0ABR3WQ87_9PEZI
MFVSTQSSKAEPQPRRKGSKMDYGPDGFDLTLLGRRALPRKFRDITISHTFVEFLRVGVDSTPVEVQNRAKNHAILKVDLTSGYDGFEGVRITMLPNWEVASDGPPKGPSYKPGQCFVKPVRYSGPSNSTARTCQFDFAQGVPLEWLLAVIEDNNLHRFYFVDLNDKYYGCRDFVTQLLYQLFVAAYTTGSIIGTYPEEPGLPEEVTNICATLGYRYMAEPLGMPYPCPIDRGYFSHYWRVEEPYMPYEPLYLEGNDG